MAPLRLATAQCNMAVADTLIEIVATAAAPQSVGVA